ncbi:MAG: hypothetical protein Q9169_005544 [Polycauliona sp. 2 TL-2023]
MFSCHSPLTVPPPAQRQFQPPKSLRGTTDLGQLRRTHLLPSDRQHGRHLGATQGRIRIPRQKGNKSDGQQLDKSQILSKLHSKKISLDASLVQLQSAIDKAMDLEPSLVASTELLAVQKNLQADIMALKDELEVYRDDDPRQMEKKTREIAQTRTNAERWTNNIELLEAWLDRVLGIDPCQLDCLRRECYGAEYVEGEGLKEL